MNRPFIPPPGHSGVHHFIDQIASRNSSAKVIDCFKTMEKIIKNITNFPYDIKYRKIRIRSETYSKYITEVINAEKLLTIWLNGGIQVIDHEEYLILDDIDLERFIETIEALVKKREHILEQMNKKDTTKEDELARKLAVLQLIEDDKKNRKK